jgi:transcriptional regulator with XRE-family HTH domain
VLIRAHVNLFCVRMSKLHIRLQEERVRLELNQDQFAEFGGVKRRAQINYESGERCPDGHYFEGIAAAGADVQYILTGIRSYQVAEESPGYSVLNKRESVLLDNYRHIADEEDKRCVERTVLLAAKAADKDDEKSGAKKKA